VQEGKERAMKQYVDEIRSQVVNRVNIILNNVQ
jgi:hypothetical protein